MCEERLVARSAWSVVARGGLGRKGRCTTGHRPQATCRLCSLQDGTYVTPPFKIRAPGRGPWSLLGARLKISKGEKSVNRPGPDLAA